MDRLKKATQGREDEEVFMTSASPGVIARFLPNQYCDSEEAYLYALADVIKDEYNAVVDAGFLLQIDCPDLASSLNTQFGHLIVDEFKKIVELHIEVLNHALAGIPPERLRMHLFWGNFEGPHIQMCPSEISWISFSKPVPPGSRSMELILAMSTSGRYGRT